MTASLHRNGRRPASQWRITPTLTSTEKQPTSKDAFPVVPHADDDPTLGCGFVVESLGKCPNLCIGQPLCGTIGVFALGVIVQYQHRKPFAAPCRCVFQHLPIPSRVAKCSVRSPPDHQMDPFRFSGVV